MQNISDGNILSFHNVPEDAMDTLVDIAARKGLDVQVVGGLCLPDGTYEYDVIIRRCGRPPDDE